MYPTLQRQGPGLELKVRKLLAPSQDVQLLAELSNEHVKQVESQAEEI